MLKSYSFMHDEIDMDFYYSVWHEIERLHWYFVKFAGVNTEEAKHRTLMHTLTHFNPSLGNLSAYVKKLAREITKNSGREVLVDFLENTVSDEIEDTGTGGSGGIDTGRVKDFSLDIIDDIVNSDDNRRTDIEKLALDFMGNFVMLCEALINHDTSTKYYPELFIKSCLDLNSVCRNFNKLCLDVFMEYGDDMKLFLSLHDDECAWHESDFTMIKQSYSKRILFLNAVTKQSVEDADKERYILKGNLGKGAKRKKIVKVNYFAIWDFMCDLIDDFETNELKFVIGDNYIIRTFGGSFSVLNPELYNLYDVVRMEIVTNVIYDSNARIINVGSENLYLLCPADMNKSEFTINVNSHSFRFLYEDITDAVQSL